MVRVRFVMAAVLASFMLMLPFSSLQAQQVPAAFEMPLPGTDAYSDAIPTPKDVIGHVIGERHTLPYQMVDYFEAVAASSDRVMMRTHGYTYENRPLVHAIITSPENHARLDEIKAQHLRLSEEAGSVSEAEIADMPVVLYQGYSIHGNEASGAEAALLYLYHLAASEGEVIDNILDNAVIILDPLFNPDGRDRFSDWANRNRGGVHTSDPQDREHNEPWPGGRTNHYWFDLNRDWLLAQHPESQGRLNVFHEWRPVILTDHHEMGGNSTFFFMPGIPSRNNPITPEEGFELTGTLAEYHVKWLDMIGSLYYAREGFDDYYYGKGSTYPDVNGTVGILFEQGSSRSLETETSHGNLHYAFTVRNQFATSLSTIEGAVAHKDQFLGYHQRFYASVSDAARQHPVKAYVIEAGENPARMQAMAQVLLRHRVEMYMLAQDVEAGGRQYSANEAVVIPLDQTQHRLVRGVMERPLSFQDSLFYDVSAWTFPLAFGLKHAEIRNDPGRLLGDRIDDSRYHGGERIGGASKYGYIIPWGRYFTPRALYKIQAAGLYPRVIHKPVTINVDGQNVALDRGAIFVSAVNRASEDAVDPAKLEALMDDVAENDHVQVYAVQSGHPVSGPDFGGPSTSVLEKPSIALVTGSGASSYNAGEAWHLLTERFQIPISLLESDRVARSNLDRYNTIVLAGGFYNSALASALQTWVRDGGRLITLQNATDWATNNELLDLEEKSFEMDSLLMDYPYDELGMAGGAQFIGGAIFEMDLDTTHPLAYGYDDSVPVFRRGSNFYEVSEEPGATVGRYSASPLLSGYISEERLELMPGSAAFVTQQHGRGQVIALMDNPNFRAFWYGTNGLFLNAIFLGDAF